MRGIVDSEDLPLNISREMLQKNPVLAKIKQGLTRHILGDFNKFGENKEKYEKFWDNFGTVLKEGLYEDEESRDDLLKLLRFRSSAINGLTSLEDYVGRMKENQDAIFYICGEDAEKLARNPHLEGFRAKGVEVLLLTDTVDDFWPSAVGEYKGKPFKSATRAGQDLGKIKSGETEKDKAEKTPETQDGDLASLIALIKLTLGNVVKDVRGSDRLTDSPVCLVADEGDIDIHLERFLKQHSQIRTASQRILELNPKHSLITRMTGRAKDNGASDALKDVIWLLFDQAQLMDGETPPDPAAFGKRLGAVLEKVV
jgi:molecular chaperone HtpG